MTKLRYWISFTAIVLTTSFSACSNGTKPRYSIIQGLRVLALTLDQPEVNYSAGTFTPATVNLSPWISDLYGSGRALSMNVYICLDPGVGLGATPNCTSSAISTLSYQSILKNQAVANSATFLSPNYTGALASIPISLASLGTTINAAVSSGSFSMSSAESYNGYSVLIFFELYATADPTTKITSFKRLVFSGGSKATKNQNPSGFQIQFGGTEITSLPTAVSDLLAYAPSTSAENYLSLDDTGNYTAKTESLLATWYLTGPSDVSCSKDANCTPDGTLALAFTNLGQANTFTPPKSGVSSRGRVLIGVLKDDRGGNQVKRYCDGICP